MDRAGGYKPTRAGGYKPTPLYWVVVAVMVLLAGGCGSSKTREAIEHVREQPLDPDLEAMRKTDPALLIYGPVAKIPTGFKEARGVAVTAEGVYVVGDQAISEFGFDGARKASVPLPREPQCVAVDAAGTAYVGGTDRVMVVAGSQVQTWPSCGPEAVFTSIAVHGADVWVADAGNRVIRRFGKDRRVGGTFGKRDSQSKYPGLIVPSPHLDVAVEADGNLVVTNPGTHRVETHSPDGKLLSAWGGPSSEIDGFCGCCNPTDIALLNDGSVVTAEKGVLRVKVYDSHGKFAGVVAGAESFNETVTALDVAAYGGRVYVLDPFDKVVRVYAPNPKRNP